MRLPSPALLLLVPLIACYDTAGRRSAGDDDGPDDDGAGDDDGADGDASDDDDSDDDDSDAGDDDVSDDDSDPDCAPEGVTDCLGAQWRECADGSWLELQYCVEPMSLCDADLGCLACAPNSTFCDGNAVFGCAPDGMSFALVESCDPNETCVGGACLSACDQAAAQFSYLGCEFLAVTTSNIVSSTFDNDFAVVIGAPASGPQATVTVSRLGSVIGSLVVQPGQTAAIPLPMVPELKGATSTATVTDGAYEVQSDTPVVAYQYNPLHFDIGGEASYTNDASLLLPEHALTGTYRVLTWPTWGYGTWSELPFFGLDGSWNAWHPGFVAVAATEDNTQVTITASTWTEAGSIGALAPGQQATVTLQRGDVIQVFSQIPDNTDDDSFCADQGWTQTAAGCPPGLFSDCEVYCSVDDGDLSGTRIEATAPVATFNGHMCTFMPYDQWACDHLEEMAFPVETWGTQVVMAALVAPSGSGVVPSRYRVMALENNTALTFQPAVSAATTLNAEEFVEFQTDQDFVVEGSQPILVTQTMLSQDAIGQGSGDPAMGTGIPVIQTRTSYDILVPDTYTSNYINLVAPTGANVTLDGAPVAAWTAVGTSGYDTARIGVAPGGHHLESAGGVRFGITAYGYASYTSYLYPGGMNFTR